MVSGLMKFALMATFLIGITICCKTDKDCSGQDYCSYGICFHMLTFESFGGDLEERCIQKGPYKQIPVAKDTEMEEVEPVDLSDSLVDWDFVPAESTPSIPPSVKQERGIPQCGYTRCEDPTIRDRYSKSMRKNLKLEWLIYGTPNATLEKSMSIATWDLNKRYTNIGVSMISFVQYFQLGSEENGRCTGFLPRIRYGKTEEACFFTRGNDPCFSTLAVLEKVQGKQWQNRNAVQIIMGDKIEKNVVGYSTTPWRKDSGYIFLSIDRVALGYSTLAHEMGHIFGLTHTFQGYSDKKCMECQEALGSNVAGDFCSDTHPIPISWTCANPSIKLHPNRCNSTQSAWVDTPYRNLMSYGPHNCRDQLTDCQIRRIRCYLMNMGGLFK
jgi:hypothetical protein